jgi:hypothetical protein
LASLGLIVEELEDLFGNHANDLTTKKTAENIQRQIEELISHVSSNVSLRAATKLKMYREPFSPHVRVCVFYVLKRKNNASRATFLGLKTFHHYDNQVYLSQKPSSGFPKNS